MLDAQDLHITFNPGTPIENPVLRGMTLSIPEGEFVSVIGSNGAGKSTFLNAIAGDLRVDSGTIRINHEDVTRLPTWDRSERVARVFQDPMAGTCEALTIEENMALALARGKSRRLRRAIDRQTRELFRERLSILRLGLENRLTDRIGLLSGGQRQAQIAQGRTPAIGLAQVAHGHQGRGAVQGRNGIEACIGALRIRRRRRQRAAHEGSPDSSVVEAGHRSARVSPA